MIFFEILVIIIFIISMRWYYISGKVDNLDLERYKNEIKDLKEKDINKICEDASKHSAIGFILPEKISSKDDFANSFDELMSLIYKAEKEKNNSKIIELSKYMIKCYSDTIIKFGRNRDKTSYYKYLNLLIKEKIISE